MDDTMAAVDARLSFLERQMSELTGSMKTLADDMHHLALANARRDQDAESIKRAFAKIESIESSVQDVRDRIDRAEKQRLHSELARAHAEEQIEEDRRAQVKYEIFRTALIVIASILLYHFGIKLIGG